MRLKRKSQLNCRVIKVGILPEIIGQLKEKNKK